MRVALIIGTRPEAIKMCSVHRALLAQRTESIIISTGQHSDLLDTAFAALEMTPDHDLKIMEPNQSLSAIASHVLERLPSVLQQVAPDAVLVQGDTTTALAGALAAYYERILVGHIEAGLRTYNPDNPFPEEVNRQVIARLAHWNFAPTDVARRNLLSEGVRPDRILVTGNTGIDTLLRVVERLGPRMTGRPYVLVTLHRRESFGGPLREIAGALLDFLAEESDAEVLWPVHPNPQVQAAAAETIGAHPRVRLCEPLRYTEFAMKLADARVVLSDSGGVQEEAPSLGKTVLIARDTTERPEAVATGQNVLVGRDRARIGTALRDAWNKPPYTGRLPAPNPYGDGHAAERIAAAIADGAC